MKYRKTLLSIIGILAIGISTLGITGCGQQTDQIELEYAVPDYDITEDSEVALLPWLQLGSLESHPELRQAFDEYFNITGETGNKVGSIYYNTDTEKADQNVTLFMVLKNQSTRNAFISLAPMEAFGAIAAENYADVEADDLASAYATINAYFELLPDQEAGHFDGDCTISRAQAMALLMRATTPVNESGAPEVNKDFTSKVGESQYTDFAAPMNEFAYLNTEKGLNIGAFNTAMSKGEYICMITNLIQADYLAEIESQGFEDIYADKDVTISVVTDAGNITFADAISDASKGVPSDMYVTFKTAIKYGLLPEEALEDWDSSITKAEAVELFVSMAANYSSNIGNLLYTGSDNAIVDANTAEVLETLKEQGYDLTAEDIQDIIAGGLDPTDTGVIEEYEIEKFGAELPGEGTPGQKLMDWAKSQGADNMWGWTLIYTHGEGAGDQPTYGKYVKPGSSRYGEIFHVGDYLPCNTQLTGTKEEYQNWMAQDFINQAEENGDEVIYEDDAIIIDISD